MQCCVLKHAKCIYNMYCTFEEFTGVNSYFQLARLVHLLMKRIAPTPSMPNQPSFSFMMTGVTTCN